jgi:hypothetical protein
VHQKLLFLLFLCWSQICNRFSSLSLFKLRNFSMLRLIQYNYIFVKARRSFHVLKGIIRLQALFRGHLVRRQAVATLHCLQGIVKLQALIRGRGVRVLDNGQEALTKGSPGRFLVTSRKTTNSIVFNPYADSWSTCYSEQNILQSMPFLVVEILTIDQWTILFVLILSPSLHLKQFKLFA